MDALRRLLLLIAIAGCAETPRAIAPHETSPQSPPKAALATSERFTVPLPSGYADVTAEFREAAPSLAMVLRANDANRGYEPTIVVRKVPLRGGSFADPATCARTGAAIVAGDPGDPGTGGTLLSAGIIEGPLGKTCQIHIRAPEGSARGGSAIALITELYGPGNTPQNPQEIWLMTCNHAEGDTGAEATCRKTLAGFRFRRP